MATLAASTLKHDIEAHLAKRIPCALSPLAQQTPRLYPIGNTAVDELLGGGLPLGSVCELTGPPCSGTTTLALSLLARASNEAACAYIDVSNALSPHCAAAAGVDLSNLLWVRCNDDNQPSITSTEPSQHSRPMEADNRSHRPMHSGCGNSHPRGETKGLAPALEQMLFYKEERRRRKTEGTPGHPNQPLGLHTASQDQVEWERFNLRKVDETDPLRQINRKSAEEARIRASSRVLATTVPLRDHKPWNRLERALRATDQVLQSGGFRIIMLDLASIEPQQALRIPSATWFRFRRAAHECDAILLLLTREPCARSSAACVLECSIAEPPKVQGVLTEVPRRVEVARQRIGPAFGRKAPGRATEWNAAPAWMRAARQ